MNGSTPRVPSDGPIPAELLAELQAGLLDDATAARVRSRIRTDSQAGPPARSTLAALDRVRRDLAALGQDTASAPPVPDEVSTRLSQALRAEPAPSRRGWKRLAAVSGAAAAVTAAAVGAVVLLRPAEQAPSAITSLGQITVSPPRSETGLTEAQLLGLLAEPPALGPLAEPRQRAACLGALGYPGEVRILGGRPLEVAGRHGVLLLVPPNAGDNPGVVTALVVAADCGADHATLLARTVIERPPQRP